MQLGEMDPIQRVSEQHCILTLLLTLPFFFNNQITIGNTQRDHLCL